MQKPALARSGFADPRIDCGREAGLAPVGLAMGGTVGVTAKSLGFLQPRLQQLNVFAQPFRQFSLPVPQLSLARRLTLAQAAQFQAQRFPGFHQALVLRFQTCAFGGLLFQAGPGALQFRGALM